MFEIPLLSCKDCKQKDRCVDFLEFGCCSFMLRLKELYEAKDFPLEAFLADCQRILVDFQKRYT